MSSSVQQSFKPGDVVRLRSGSPAMTISTVGDDVIRTFWFHNGELRQGVLPLITIRDDTENGPEARYRHER